MIPTSATSSSPPTATIGNQMNNSPNIPGNANASNGGTGNGGNVGTVGTGQINSSAFLGIASLILEGRALAEDEYAAQTTRQEIKQLINVNNAAECGRQSPKPSTSRAAFGDNYGGTSGASNAMTSSFSIDLANYLGRKSSNSPDTTSGSFLRDYYSSSSESAASSVESNHSRWSQKLSQLRQESPTAQHQMLAARQKIAVECVRGSEAEYVALAINTEHSSGGIGINEERRTGGAGGGGGDFEILRRMSINQMNFYNSPNTMGGGGAVGLGGGGSGSSTENFMCSLQSLASNTCLRVRNPLLVSNASPPRYLNNRHVNTSSTTRFSTPTSHQHLDFPPNSSSNSLGSSTTTNNWHPATSPPLMANSSSSSSSGNSKEYLLRKSSTAATTIQRMPIPITSAQATNSKSSMNSSINSQNLQSNIFSRNTLTTSTNSNAAATCTSTPNTNASRNQTSYPKQGPHCDQFLRKMGLAKGDASDAEEHHCDMSYVNITCTRWRAYCIKMENILARGEPICIEVYLGPVGHKILLEQWIITQKEKQPPPTMTLPSLCSAIRSQLYFSQISAWCDLIKKSDKTIYETGRVIYTTPPTTNAAGDLATTIANASTCATTTTTNMQPIPVTNPVTLLTTTSTQQQQTNSGAGVGSGLGMGVGVGIGVNVGGCCKKAPRLNIFYRIKKYDSTACFNSKPNVHNFPNVNISENCCLSVCLKSLPRITGGIPKVGNTGTTTQAQISPTIGLTTSASGNSEDINKTKKAKSEAKAESKSTTTTTTNANNKSTILTMNCDNNLKELQQQKSITASTSSCCSPSTFFQNGKNSKISEEHSQDIDFACEEEQQIDLNAGGDNTNISCSSSLVGGNDYDSSNSSFSTNNCGNLSHREKQLLKYRKRMMKRDKKQQLRKTNENTLNQIQNESKMEQGDDEEDDDEDDVNVHHNEGSIKEINGESSKELKKFSNNTSLENGQRQLQYQQQLPNNHTSNSSSSSNSIPSNSMLIQLNQNPQPQHVKMISTGTQTMTNSCTSCGNEKSMVCLKCNTFKGNSSTTNYEEIMEAETLSLSSSSSSSVSSLSSSDIIQTPRNKAELLLQAIQRTPKSNKKHKQKSKDSKQMAAIKPQQQQPTKTKVTTPLIIPNSTNNLNRKSSSHSPQMNGGSSNSSNNSTNNSLNNRNSNPNSNNIMMMGCQVCKRQKTQHHFNQSSSTAIEDLSSEDNNISSSNGIDTTNKTSITSTNHTASEDGGCGLADGEDESDNEKDGGRILEDLDCVDNVSIVIDDVEKQGNGVMMAINSASGVDYNEHEIMEEEYFESSTKLTPHIDRCSLNSKSYYGQINKSNIPPQTESIQYQPRSCSTPPLEEQKTNANNVNDANAMMAQFKTPTPSEQQQNVLKNKTQQQQQPHKQTPKPNLLHIACNFNRNNDEQHDQKISKLNHLNAMDNNTPTSHNPLLLRRSLPKVNLTPIFCNPNSMMVVASSPIPIGNGSCNGTATNDLTCKSAEINITQASPTFSFESPSSPAPSITVQKSNSAPTLPNSPSLSPRFVKASAIYKRRSRHLSDRSDRSSLGSDEQFSDEDIDSGMYSPFATSPVKLRTRLAAVFGRKPLLGNLEECLLQRRLVPKIEVMGFKLLLGASGGFCPTQLTIPAAAYFYELKGETLSTPYLCEIRLPRKGYTVPRCGTVQATLLNPMGTVVRMFVIPYDMRDMPTLHQTFIRQRILADTGVQSQQDDNIDVSKQNGVPDGDEKIVGDIEKSENLAKQQHQSSFSQQQQQQQLRSPQCNNENNLGHFISAENMKSLRYSIHLRFQTSRSGRLMLHTDIRLLISRRTDCDTAAAHAKGVLEAPNELITNTVMPTNPKYSARQDQTSSKI